MEGSTIVFILLCSYILTSAFGDSISKECFCELPYGSGCDFSTVLDPKNWRKENVALGQRVTISSTLGKYRNNEEKEMQGCMAANGNIDNVYVSRSDNNTNVKPNCFRTGPSDRAPFWEVDLGKNYSISEVTIHLESILVGVVLNNPVLITVDDKECIKITNLTLGFKNEIQCVKSVRGRRVKLQMIKPSDATDQIWLCEVQVWGCQSKYFKEDCSRMCNEGCSKGCDNFNGICVENCIDGYFSLYCDKLCGACEEKRCNRITGMCESNRCQNGWTGKRCDEVCAHGYFGANCSSKCPTCPQGTSCNRFNGSCIVGCGDGFTGPDCKEPCKNNTWGPNCSNMCGRCKDRVQCDTLQGHCHSGCEIGSKPPICTAHCDKKTYGVACQSACGNCKLKGECNVKYGTCPDGCDEGWTTDLCNEGCKPGLYGANCKEKCGYCAGVACDRFTGVCLTGCEAGWISIFCNKPCAPGTWGMNCNVSCGFCESGLCNNRDGICDKCAPGYQGELCNEEFVRASEDYYQTVYKQEVVTTTILIAGVCIVAVTVAVFLIVIRKQRPDSLSDLRQQEITLEVAPPVIIVNTTALVMNESEVMQTTSMESRNDVPEETLKNYNATEGKSPFGDGVKEHQTEKEKRTEETGYEVDSKEYKERKEHNDGMNEPHEVDESSDFGRTGDISIDDEGPSDVDDTSIHKISAC